MSSVPALPPSQVPTPPPVRGGALRTAAVTLLWFALSILLRLAGQKVDAKLESLRPK